MWLSEIRLRAGALSVAMERDPVEFHQNQESETLVMRTTSVAIAALCLVVCAAAAMADVGVTLNLFYNDPTNPYSGGTWEVAVVSLDPTESVVAVNAVLGGIDDPSGVVTVPSGLGDYVEHPSYPGYAPVFTGSTGYQIGYVQLPFPSGYLWGGRPSGIRECGCRSFWRPGMGRPDGGACERQLFSRLYSVLHYRC